MKKIFLSMFFAIVAMSANAQYYNPYNPYMNQKSMQDAYNMGANMMKQMMAEAWNDPAKTFNSAIEYLANGNIDNGFKYMDRAADLGNKLAYSYLGNLYELGIGTDPDTQNAKFCYEMAENQDALWRIRTTGYWEATNYNRGKYLDNVRNIYYGIQSTVQSTINGVGSSSSSSGRRTCPGCSGKGKGVDQITYSPNYTGRDNSRYCSICGRTMPAHSHHSPMCRTCYGKGYVE